MIAPSEKPLRIISLRSENVKRLSVVEISPDGNVITIGGKNSAGKSSVLDSIEMALRGRTSIPSQPIRHGQDRADIKIDLGEIEVERIITPSGNRLVVKNKGGGPVGSPQAILDKLIGAVSFDPLEFSRMRPKDQATQLQTLMGLDFTAMDKKRKEYFEERTLSKRENDKLKATIDSEPPDPDAPAEPVSLADLTEELQKRLEEQGTNQKERDKLPGLVAAVTTAESVLRSQDQHIERLEATLREIQEKLRLARIDGVKLAEAVGTAKNAVDAQQMLVGGLFDPDIDSVKAKIEDAERLNARYRANEKRAEQTADLEKGVAYHDNLTTQIQAIDLEKERQAREAKFPIDGLGFDIEGVTYNNVPFEQIGSAEKLRISVAVGIALNPRLRVILIRDGSLLDDDGLKLVAEMAEAADAQVWVERVSSDGDGCSVVMEDGHVQGVPVVAG